MNYILYAYKSEGWDRCGGINHGSDFAECVGTESEVAKIAADLITKNVNKEYGDHGFDITIHKIEMEPKYEYDDPELDIIQEAPYLRQIFWEQEDTPELKDFDERDHNFIHKIRKAMGLDKKEPEEYVSERSKRLLA